MELESFSLEQAKTIVAIYVCAQCEGELQITSSDWNLAIEDNVLFDVLCPDCGYIEQVGRISKTTVAIRREQGVHSFYRVVKTLPNLWGELLEKYQAKYRIQPRAGETRREANLRELGF